MSHIIPYISTEPPSIHEDSIDRESIESDKNTDIVLYSKKDGSVSNVEDVELNDVSGTTSHSAVELREYIDQIIEDNHLELDVTDYAIKRENGDDGDNDVMSDCSFEGQFDGYIDTLNDGCGMHDTEAMECDGVINLNKSSLADSYKSNVNIDDTINTTEDCDFGDFGSFSNVIETSTDYFNETNNESASFAFTHFQVCDSEIDVVDSCVNDPEEIDDDFDDFATFDNDSVNVPLSEPTYINTQSQEQTVDEIVELFQHKLLSSVNSIDIELKSFGYDESCSLTPNNYLTNDCSIHIWKEMTNFDYSPAFIFQWMQSTSYENYMASIGPDYKELLSSQRATLPLYSVNLTPIEPVLVDNFIQNIHSTTSSSLDLSVHEKSGNVSLEKSSNIDIKNLEDEFIFNTNLNDESNISNIKSDSRSSMPNLSSAVIQLEGIGGIFKSMLKPLNSGKTSATNKPLNPKAEAVLKELPDLSYMTSKVLMFPVLTSYDVQDSV